MKTNAQALPDTSLNQVVPDSMPERNAPVLTKPSADETAYDSLKGIVQPFQPNPKKSALYSAILPGSGQLYNRQYWKVPVIYVGIAVSLYFLNDNSTNYQRYRIAYVSRISNPNYQDEFTGVRTEADLKLLQDYYKKYLDMTVLVMGLGYTLQVLDALAFAHLKNFDISRNISVRMKALSLPNGSPAIGLAMNF